jgi:hypothetical protein
MLTNESERIGKGRQGFAVPGRLANGKRLPIQQLLSKNGDKRKQAQQRRSRAQDGQIRPLALGLHPQMVTHLMKGDLDRPAQDKPLHDLDRLGLLISRRASPWARIGLGDRE